MRILYESKLIYHTCYITADLILMKNQVSFLGNVRFGFFFKEGLGNL